MQCNNWTMNTSKFGIGKVEAFQIHVVKNEPCETSIFTKCRSCGYSSYSSETDFVDHKNATDSYQQQNEEKLDNDWTINTSKLEIGKVEAFQIDAVKNEPCETSIFTKCRSCGNSSNFADHKNATDSYQNQNEEILDVKNLVLGDLSHSKLFDYSSTSTCNTVGIKNEIDIFYEDVKCETDSELPLELRDETISRNEVTKEQDSSAKSDLMMKHEFCSEPLENNLSLAEKKNQCKSCSKSFSQIDKLKVHERVHAAEKLCCKICSKGFTTSNNLKVHKRCHTGEKSYECKTCSKAFTRSSYLKVHERCHTGEKAFQCKMCSKYFSNKSNLKVHQRSHIGEKQFQCKICLKSFSQVGKLKVHEKVHSAEKLYCEICSNGFSTSSNLKVHKRCHTGEKPFSCKICSKAFARSSDLKVHEKGHTGEKPFRCKICFKSFTRASYLKVHERGHAGDKAFHCQICSKSFTLKSNLKVHERGHTGERPYHCKICSKSFAHKGNLKVHEMGHSRENHFVAKFV